MEKFKTKLKDIEHDYLVNKLILMIKDYNIDEYSIIDTYIKNTYILIDTYDESKNMYNNIDNNIFELENLLNDLKYQLDKITTSSNYLFLINKDINYLQKMINRIENFHKDQISMEIVTIDLNKYKYSIINDYVKMLNNYLNLNNLLKLAHQLNIEYINELLHNELTIDELNYIYKVTNGIMKELNGLNVTLNQDLENKHDMFEFMYMVLRVN